MTKLPETILPEAEMVDVVAHWIDCMSALMTTEAARIVLRDHIRAMVRAGTLPTMRVIAAARGGHQDADMALRELIAETIDRSEGLPTALAAYAQEAMFQGPTSYPPGRNLADTWLRDIGIALLVSLAAETWHLKPTRNRASRRPSACSIAAAALNRRGHNITEKHVDRIFSDHARVAKRLSASIPPI
jgi:hypothetical protein